MTKIIGSGAEAVIYKDDNEVTKHRVKKGYRHKDIDKSLRKRRTKREYKVLEKMYSLGLATKPLSKCDKDMKIHYEYIDGDKLRDVLHKNHKKWGKEIGKALAKMHKNDIIHGDLTTSNMIVKDELKLIDAEKSKILKNSQNFLYLLEIFNFKEISGISKEKVKFFFIDFGLSYFSTKHEDKAVDLHLLKRALESKHHEIFEEVFDIVLKEYEKELLQDGKETIKRLEKVTKRGRNKNT